MLRTLSARVLLGVALSAAVQDAAAETVFVFRQAYRDVAADPDRVWSAEAFAGGTASIFEYELRTGTETLIVSQIWNEDCGAATCPTRLVRLDASGRRTVLVDDMMQQVIPPHDPRFAALTKSGPQAAFAQTPFRLSEDGKTLLNGDFSFELGARP